MAEKILINQSLADRFRPLLEDLQKLDIEFFPITLGSELENEVTLHSPQLLILTHKDVDIGGVPLGCKALVLAEGYSTEEVKRMREVTKAAVLVEPVSEVQLLEKVLGILRPEAQPKSEEDRLNQEEIKRIATRVDISGPVTYLYKEKQKQGWAVNASRSGILFAANEPIKENSALSIRFDMPDGNPLDIAATVIRSISLETTLNSFGFSIGAKFHRLRDADKDRLDLLMEARSLAMAKQLSPIFLKELLENGERILVDAFQKEINPTGLAIYLKEVGPFEREAFTSDGAIQELVRRLVAMRMQCYAFRIFLPAVRANRKYLVPTIIPMMSKLIKKADDVENEVDQFIKEAARRSEDINRPELNESSNRLYQAKIKLMTAVTDLISPEGLGPESEAVQRIIARVRVLQEIRQGPPSIVRFEKKTTSVITKSKDISRKKIEKPESSSSFAGLFRIVVVALVGSLVIFFFLRKSNQISPSELQIGIPVDKVDRIEQTISIQTQSIAWRNLPKKNKEEVAGMVENVLRQKELNQATIIDDKGRELLTIVGQETPTGTIYQRNFPKK